MDADAQRLAALTAQLAEPTEQVRKLTQREIAVDLMYRAGFEAGEASVVPGRPRKPARVIQFRPAGGGAS